MSSPRWRVIVHAVVMLRSVTPCALLVLLVGCGSRSWLPDTEPPAASPPSQDRFPDEGGPDDGLPPVPPATPPSSGGCPDAAATLIYVVTNADVLMSFDPTTETFTTIGKLDCPAPEGYTPFSMAVDREGIAYVLYTDPPQGSQLFRVSTATASCRATPFTSGQQGFGQQFGMAFVEDTGDDGETLYVAEGNMAPQGAGCMGASRLATIDTTSFALDIVGTLEPSICSPELTGNASGGLFGFYATTSDMRDSFIGQIDRTSATLTSQSTLVGLGRGSAWAFGFWGGDFYTFTAPGATSVVTRFRPSDGSVVQVAQAPGAVIVGAGVSTCAPEQ